MIVTMVRAVSITERAHINVFLTTPARLIAMIARNDLRKMAKARLKDAEVLFQHARYDSATYLSGYAIELALKARLCMVLKWEEFPESNKDFEDYRSFRTHDLNVLLSLSKKQDLIITNHEQIWRTVESWSSDARYKRVGSVDKAAAMKMLDAVRFILGVVL